MGVGFNPDTVRFEWKYWDVARTSFFVSTPIRFDLNTQSWGGKKQWTSWFQPRYGSIWIRMKPRQKQDQKTFQPRYGSIWIQRRTLTSRGSAVSTPIRFDLNVRPRERKQDSYCGFQPRYGSIWIGKRQGQEICGSPFQPRYGSIWISGTAPSMLRSGQSFNPDTVRFELIVSIHVISFIELFQPRYGSIWIVHNASGEIRGTAFQPRYGSIWIYIPNSHSMRSVEGFQPRYGSIWIVWMFCFWIRRMSCFNPDTVRFESGLRFTFWGKIGFNPDTVRFELNRTEGFTWNRRFQPRYGSIWICRCSWSRKGDMVSTPIRFDLN